VVLDRSGMKLFTMAGGSGLIGDKTRVRLEVFNEDPFSALGRLRSLWGTMVVLVRLGWCLGASAIMTVLLTAFGRLRDLASFLATGLCILWELRMSKLLGGATGAGLAAASFFSGC